MYNWTKEKKTGDYNRIREILSQIEELEVRQVRGATFRFPIYMTESLSQTDIDALELSVRSSNCLKRAGIHTIGELCSFVRSTEDLKPIKNCGHTSIAEIMDHLFAYQYVVLKPERRKKFLADVIKRNLGKREPDLRNLE